MNPEGSLRDWARDIGIAHTSLENRLYYVDKKGYIEKIDGKFRLTAFGRERFMNDEIHNRYIRTNK